MKNLFAANCLMLLKPTLNRFDWPLVDTLRSLPPSLVCVGCNRALEVKDCKKKCTKCKRDLKANHPDIVAKLFEHASFLPECCQAIQDPVHLGGLDQEGCQGGDKGGQGQVSQEETSLEELLTFQDPFQVSQVLPGPADRPGASPPPPILDLGPLQAGFVTVPFSGRQL